MITEERLASLLDGGYVWHVEYSVSVAGGATHYAGIVVDTDQCELRDLGLRTEANSVLWALYRDTSFTGGSDIALMNRNDSHWGETERNPLSSAKGGVTATPSAGNKMTSALQSVAGQFENAFGAQTGQPIIMAPGGSYVFSITNNDGTAKLCAFSATLVRRNF